MNNQQIYNGRQKINVESEDFMTEEKVLKTMKMNYKHAILM